MRPAPQPSVSAAEFRRRSRPREAAILNAVLECLAVHPAVARAWRQNQGAMKASYTRKRDNVTKTRVVRFAAVDGISDVIGYLKNGRFLAVECKREGESLTTDQRMFLHDVQKNGGVAIAAWSVDDVIAGLKGEPVLFLEERR